MTACPATGVPTARCMHCPAEPERADPLAGIVWPPDGREPAKALTEARRAKLLATWGWYSYRAPTVWQTARRCGGCGRRLKDGEPVTSVYGYALVDMRLHGYCCPPPPPGQVVALDEPKPGAAPRPSIFGG